MNDLIHRPAPPAQPGSSSQPPIDARQVHVHFHHHYPAPQPPAQNDGSTFGTILLLLFVGVPCALFIVALLLLGVAALALHAPWLLVVIGMAIVCTVAAVRHRRAERRYRGR